MKTFIAVAAAIAVISPNGVAAAKATKKPINWAQRCFEDYCPCDTADPDYGGADVVICRNMKMGVKMSADMIAGAAGMRDARRSLREWKRSNPGY